MHSEAEGFRLQTMVSHKINSIFKWILLIKLLLQIKLNCDDFLDHECDNIDFITRHNDISIFFGFISILPQRIIIIVRQAILEWFMLSFGNWSISLVDNFLSLTEF